MSEPSPEAKQALTELNEKLDLVLTEGEIEAVVICVANAATAKLVVRLAQMEQWLADVGYSAEEIDKALKDYGWVKPGTRE